MSYLKDFQTRITNHDYPAFLRLWEEYCSADEVDAEELRDVLKAVKGSTIAEPFGRHIERVLHLWKTLSPSLLSDEILKLIIDLQTTNNDCFAQLAYDFLKERYSQDKYFNDKIRLVGLRGKEIFQEAISNYELLSHIDKGNYVFHTGGWGVGEIVDFSLVREQLSVEFDYVPGKKDLSFSTAFKTLIPVPKDHFLAMRFGNPDLLEKKAKESPAEVIRMLLRDLGPKTAAEIKDELCELVIPADEWTRWWQTTRAKVKKDTMVETPEELKKPFRLRKSEVTHEEKLAKILENKPDANTLIQMLYSFVKDYPETLRNTEFKATLIARLEEALKFPELNRAQELQMHFFLQDLKSLKESPAIDGIIKTAGSIKELVDAIDILNFKKRTISEARRSREDWKEIFLDLFFRVSHAPLRDYIFTELSSLKGATDLQNKLEELCSRPVLYPEAFLWYFQKVMTQEGIPFSNKGGKTRFFEGLLILLSGVEHEVSQRDLTKKIHGILSAGRYAIVRQIMQDSGLEEVKEFLLLATKCHSLTDHDVKILDSLAEVAHPALAKLRKKKDSSVVEPQEIWTTQAGLQKLQQRIQKIATVETVENAKEIEVARSHGDLRENAEFKAALEKRSRLQSELKELSEQLGKARVIVKEEVGTDRVDVGVIVECKPKVGEKVSYTLLGPWDADTEKNILSFQSKLAQTMKGLKVGDTFLFQNDEYTITGICSYL